MHLMIYHYFNGAVLRDLPQPPPFDNMLRLVSQFDLVDFASLSGSIRTRERVMHTLYTAQKDRSLRVCFTLTIN